MAAAEPGKGPRGGGREGGQHDQARPRPPDCRQRRWRMAVSGQRHGELDFRQDFCFLMR